eukprot:328297-Pleurochrysis_carterae.AAC.2
MHSCRFCARIACVLGARSPSALWVSSLPSAWPTSPSPAPLTGDRPQARPAPALEHASDPYLLVNCIDKYVPARPDGSNSSKGP